MKIFWRLAALGLAIVCFSSPVRAADSVAGLWLTENQRAVIEVKPCGELTCGTVFWIIKGGLQTDTENPDPTQRTRPMCGLPVLSGFRQQDAAHWVDGRIYKADDGDVYHATLQLLPSGKLLVHGYIGMPLFGVSQTWTRVSEKDYPACSPASR